MWCGVPIRYWLTPECVVTCSRVDCHEASDPVPTPRPGRHRASSLLNLRIHTPHVNHQHYKAVTAIMAWCHAGPGCEGSGSMSVQPQLCEASSTVRVPSSNQGQPHHQQILNHHILSSKTFPYSCFPILIFHTLLCICAVFNSYLKRCICRCRDAILPWCGKIEALNPIDYQQSLQQRFKLRVIYYLV